MIGDGKCTSFWSALWCGDNTLSSRFKRLFDLSLNKDINANSVLNSNYEALTFRRWLSEEDAKSLEDLKSLCDDFNLSGSKDMIRWMINKNGFNVKSLLSQM